jgi:lysylphosphatidylglycerol synthase-like protein
MEPSPAIPALPVLVGFRAAEHAVSTLLPSAHLSGEPVRAFLLRRRGIDWPLAIASVATDRLLEMTVAAVAGPAYVVWFFAANASSAWAARWAMAGMVACIVGLVLLYVRAFSRGGFLPLVFRAKQTGSFVRSVDAIERKIVDFIRCPAFVPGLLLAALAEALVLVEFWMLARAFALPISLATLVGVMVGMGIAQLLPVPAAVGSLEATEVGVVKLAGGEASLGLAVGMIVRLRETLWIVVGLATAYLEGVSWSPAGRSSPASTGASSGTATSAATTQSESPSAASEPSRPSAG